MVLQDHVDSGRIVEVCPECELFFAREGRHVGLLQIGQIGFKRVVVVGLQPRLVDPVQPLFRPLDVFAKQCGPRSVILGATARRRKALCQTSRKGGNTERG